MMIWFSLLDLWHQWQLDSTIPHFVIDGNTHAPPIIMLFFFLPPFDINGKGKSPWWYISPYSLDVLNLMLIHLEMKLLSLCRRYSKFSLGRGLVKIYAICSFSAMYSNLMFFFVTYSPRKWNLIGICFVFGMHHYILGDVYSTSVVIEYRNGLIIFHLFVL